jgi:uncharacterized surface protein with fasciclin (FAS1) repeats
MNFQGKTKGNSSKDTFGCCLGVARNATVSIREEKTTMNKRSKVVAGVAAGALALTSLVATPAQASGTTSLATVLNTANQAYDRDWSDFDILTAAVNAVLTAKPTSAVSVLADGNTELTAFIPTDRAFRKLVKDLTGRTLKTEANVFAAVAGLGIDTVEQVLLYHVVLGAPITKAAAQAVPSGTELTTAQGATITVRVSTSLILRDKATKNTNPKVFLNRADLNAGNKQIAHAIDRVLLPIQP